MDEGDLHRVLEVQDVPFPGVQVVDRVVLPGERGRASVAAVEGAVVEHVDEPAAAGPGAELRDRVVEAGRLAGHQAPGGAEGGARQEDHRSLRRRDRRGLHPRAPRPQEPGHRAGVVTFRHVGGRVVPVGEAEQGGIVADERDGRDPQLGSHHLECRTEEVVGQGHRIADRQDREVMVRPHPIDQLGPGRGLDARVPRIGECPQRGNRGPADDQVDPGGLERPCRHEEVLTVGRGHEQGGKHPDHVPGCHGRPVVSRVGAAGPADHVPYASRLTRSARGWRPGRSGPRGFRPVLR